MTATSHPSSRDRQARGGDRGDRRGILEHEPDPRRRQRWIDRQVSRPGLEHRQNRDDRLDGTRRQQRHTLPRARTISSQQVRQPVRRLIELAVSHGTTAAAQRHRIRGADHLRGEQHRNRHPGHRLGQHRPVTDLIQPGVLTPIQHIHRRQPPCRVRGQRHQHPLEPLDQRLDAGRVEHIGAKLHHPGNPGRPHRPRSSVL